MLYNYKEKIPAMKIKTGKRIMMFERRRICEQFVYTSYLGEYQNYSDVNELGDISLGGMREVEIYE